jgi:hypothetical protein
VERIIMVVIYSDECTYSCEESYPILHLSTVDALFAFEKLNNEVGNYKTFSFCGMNFSKLDELPDFYTVDEWFEQNGNNVL